MRKEILAAIVGGIFAVISNLITAFGPAFFSWGQKPIFSTSEIYKDLKNENPMLEQSLADLLLYNNVYYNFRRTEITFKRLDGENVIIEVKVITKVRNPKEEESKYEHSAYFDKSYYYNSVVFRPQSGQPISYDKNQILSLPAQKSKLEIKYTFPEITIPGKGTLEIESDFTITKPNKNNETTFVTRRFINAPMTFTIKNEINDKRFTYDFISLSFLKQTSSVNVASSEEVITIPSPVFSGQGISLNWDTN